MSDLISRDYVLSEYDRQHNGPPGGARKIMEQAPAVDAAPVVHGRWVANSDGLPVCSVCDEIAMQRLFCDTTHGEWRYDVRLVKTPFCPSCGAKMDKEG